MKETLKFDLKASMGIIKKPESNETYYTYNIPHKIMIYGLLGAIIGLNGYNYNNLIKKEYELPEFYTKLNSLKIGIVPNILNKKFSSKIQSFNNTVGYASNEKGNILIVKEQILEEPSWQIYILGDSSKEYIKLKEYLLNRKCEYIPYIGKNEYFADISNVEVLDVDNTNEISSIDSIFDKSILNSTINEMFLDVVAFANTTKKIYKIEEVLPTSLDEKIGYTQFRPFVYTNNSLDLKFTDNIYKVNNNNIYYF